MNKKTFFKPLPTKKKKCIIILIIILAIFILPIINNKYKVDKIQNELLVGGVDLDGVQLGKTYITSLINQQSDIDGMTKFEKLIKGLDPEDGSDTDYDGLTDKEEIELYGSNPLKASTAGDLYFDSYKLENGMDLFTYYEYDEDIVFSQNECKEVLLNATTPVDLHTVVENRNGTEKLIGYNILSEYKIYYYSDRISIDLTSILAENNLDISDISLLVRTFDEDKCKKCNFSVHDNNVITLKKTFKVNEEYYVYLVEKNFWGYVNNVLFKGNVSLNTNTITGEGFVIGSPLLTFVSNNSMKIFVEELETQEATNNLKNDIIAFNTKLLGEELDYTGNTFHKSKQEIETIYSFFKTVIPYFECDGNRDNINILHYLLYYFSFQQAMPNYLSTGDNSENDSFNEIYNISEFDILVDELPFKNFGSNFSQGGNCAGIAHFTTYLYNTGSFPTTGKYLIENFEEINWDISVDKENETLSNRGLSDYKTSTFTKDHTTKDGILDIYATDPHYLLSEGEIEFVKMIGCCWKEVNDKIEIDNYTKYMLSKKYDYSLIEKMKSYIDNGKILTVCFSMGNDGAHAVNVYDYYIDETDSNILYFKVYDNNIPQDIYNNETVDCVIKVEKKDGFIFEKTCFDFKYAPLGQFAYSSSSKHLNYFFVVIDENFTILNN